MKAYMKHPVLTNPAKYIKGPRYNAPETYIPAAYSETLESNPLALGLLRTHNDVGTSRLPNGAVVRLVTQTTDGAVTLKPVYDEAAIDPNVITTPTYVFGNRNYLDYLNQREKWQSYVPTKFKQASANVRYTMKGMLQLSDEYREELEARIKRGLNDIKEGQGLGLHIGNHEKLFGVKESIIFINLPNIDEERFISYKGNETLCFDIIRLMRYYL